MKKVLVLAAAVMLFATPALAGIANSKHDLSSGTNSGGATSNTDEICVFCHTPHGAQTFGPLWNRSASTVTITSAYGDPSGTLNATVTTAGIAGSDAPLCLTCHDGSTLANMTNPPNSLTVALAITDGGNVTGGAITGNAVLDGAFNNDHPVGFIVDYTDPEIYNKTTIEGNLVAGAVSFGSGQNEMWCSSCHDVHNGTNSAFLHIDNAGSALCLACHNK